jgi:Nif-specific regulatory protein
MADSRTDSFELLYDVSRSLHAVTKLEELLPRIAEKTKDLLGVEGCSVILLDAAANELYFPIVSPKGSQVAERLAEMRMPADKGIAGAAVQSGESLLVTDVGADERFYPAMDEQTGCATRSILCAPLCTQRGTVGVIECVNKLQGEALAGSVAVAIENACLYEALRDSEGKLRDRVAVLVRERPTRQRFSGIVGKSPAMQKIFNLLESAIDSPISVLLQGETGVGKEVLARAIHFEGPRRDAAFIAVNCGAFTETLLESELFGYRKGAFTGAMTDKRGLFQAADGGTIFLDEVGDAPPTTQVKLLRVLERGEFIPIGDTQVRKVDTRIVSATNKDLAEEVRAGRFREDLYYRLNAFPIVVPRLRERAEDIPLLIAHFLKELSGKWGRPEVSVAPDAVESLMRHAWPGNVRELEHELERAVTLARGATTLDLDLFSEHVVGSRDDRASVPVGTPLKQARDAFERRYVAETLKAHDGNVSHSAKALGISRVMLQRKMRAFGLRDSPPASEDKPS